MGSNRSFGFARGRPKVLTQFTFPSGTSTWTAPAGVTGLLSAVGKGSNGTYELWQSALMYTSTVSSSSNITGSYTNVTGEMITSELNAQLAWANSLSDTVGTSSTRVMVIFRYYTTTATWARQTLNFAGVYRKTSPYISRSSNHPTTGNVTYTSASSSYVFGLEEYTPGTNGTATTGFGLSFPGGTSSVPAASNTTYTNVAVTPGTQYTIVNNGSLTINYYV